MKSWTAKLPPMGTLGPLIALVAAGRSSDATASFTGETSFRRMRGVRDLMAQMLTTERALLKQRDDAQRAIAAARRGTAFTTSRTSTSASTPTPGAESPSPPGR